MSHQNESVKENPVVEKGRRRVLSIFHPGVGQRQFTIPGLTPHLKGLQGKVIEHSNIFRVNRLLEKAFPELVDTQSRVTRGPLNYDFSKIRTHQRRIERLKRELEKDKKVVSVISRTALFRGHLKRKLSDGEIDGRVVLGAGAILFSIGVAAYYEWKARQGQDLKNISQAVNEIDFTDFHSTLQQVRGNLRKVIPRIKRWEKKIEEIWHRSKTTLSVETFIDKHGRPPDKPSDLLLNAVKPKDKQSI
ncbi:hypothetical protein HYS91_04880 [Candidatus Daviesbacteria bacterium]|nr:hypothetical protein [Candidatus Daviesbacteria bacterium]